MAIVTGGGRGIGRAIGQALARAGASLTVTARTQEQLEETVARISESGGRALAVLADVSDPEGVARVVEETRRRFGPVDVLVNNAGVVTPIGPLWENDPQEWRQCMEINLFGMFLYARAVLPAMVERGRGRVINVMSGVGLRPLPFASAYAVSKCAVARLTECIAAEAGDRGVYAFAIGPGAVWTEMARYVVESVAGQRWHAWFRKMLDDWARPPEDAARLCLSLAVWRADALTGRYLDVFDDLEALSSSAEEIRQRDLRVQRMRKWQAP